MPTISSKKSLIVMVVILLVITSFSVTLYFPNSNNVYSQNPASESPKTYESFASNLSSFKTSSAFLTNSQAIYNYTVTVTNTQKLPTGVYQQMLKVEPIKINYVNNSKWSNIKWTYPNGTVIDSWMESYNSSGAIFWLKLNSIDANSSVNLNMLVYSKSYSVLNNQTTGEAPQLSPVYAEYDNGANVFIFYDNFSGNTLSSKWIDSGISYSIDNGFNANGTSRTGYIYSQSTILQGSVIDFYGNLGYQTFDNTVESGAMTIPYENSNNYQGVAIGSGYPSSGQYLAQQVNNGVNSNVVLPGSFSNATLTIEIANSTTTKFTYNYGSVVEVNEDAPTYPLNLMLIGAPANNAAYSFTNPVFIQWFRTRAYPPNGIMPSVSFGVNVTFYETGLPSGQTWYLNLSNGQSISSNNTAVSTSLVKGTYTYTLASANKTYISQGGSFLVNGTETHVNLNFNQTYSVTFHASSIAPGTVWFVNLSNGESFFSSASSISFVEPNGTYRFTASSSNKTYSPSPSSGNFSVHGSIVAETVTFNLVKFAVTFTETGLPSDTAWYLNITGENTSGPISKQTYTTELVNGTYSFVTATYDKKYSASYGTFTVNGEPVSEPISFNLIKYNIVFEESGLPNESKWSIAVNNITETSTTTSLTFNEPNGTYDFIPESSNNAFKAGSGMFTVSGINITVRVGFLPVTYYVNFTETGLTAGTKWSVTLNGETLSSSKQFISFVEQNGTYLYSIESVSGYNLSQYTGSINVTGSSQIVQITFSTTHTSPHTSSPAGSSLSLYYFAGATITVAVIGGLLEGLKRKKP